MQALLSKNTINCRGSLINLAKPVVMGILNATPDSFFKNSRITDEYSLLSKVESMLNDGASIIDIGGQSTRPGASSVSSGEELKRIIPLVNVIHRMFPEAIISVDTFYADVAAVAIDSGASIINDVTAGEGDEKMFKTIAAKHIPYIAMHKLGTPLTMQINPQYNDIVSEVTTYFIKKVFEMKMLGMSDIIIDPGFGFGKNLIHNYNLLSNLDAFQVLELPVMVGISRKSIVQKLLSVNTTGALNGTTALHIIALQKGAKILRVHDVKEAMQCIKIGEAIGWY